MRIKTIAVFLFVLLFCFGCSSDEKISDNQILYRLDWEGKEILFFESIDLSYTDGERTYSSFHMLNSEDGTRRLYVIEDAFGIEYQVLQDGVVLEPIGTFVVKNFEGKMYEDAFKLIQQFGVIEKEMVISNVVAKIYSLDTSKSTRLWFDTMPEYMARRWEEIGKASFRGDSVQLSYEELDAMICSWNRANIAKSQIDPYSRKLLVSWDGVESNQLIYENGMQMHIPAIQVNLVDIAGEQYFEVENGLDYAHAATEYYELTETQMQEFMLWRDKLNPASSH